MRLYRPKYPSTAYLANDIHAGTYDDAGRVVQDNGRSGRQRTYDAAGHYAVEAEQRRRGGGQTTLMVTDLRLTQDYDGDGRRASGVVLMWVWRRAVPTLA